MLLVFVTTGAFVLFLFPFKTFLFPCSPIPSEGRKQQLLLLGEEAGHLESFGLGGSLSSSISNAPPHSPVPQHPPPVPPVSQYMLLGIQHTSGLRGSPLLNNQAPALGVLASPSASCSWIRVGKGDRSLCRGLWSSPSRLLEDGGFPGHLQPMGGGFSKQH